MAAWDSSYRSGHGGGWWFRCLLSTPWRACASGVYAHPSSRTRRPDMPPTQKSIALQIRRSPTGKHYAFVAMMSCWIVCAHQQTCAAPWPTDVGRPIPIAKARARANQAAGNPRRPLSNRQPGGCDGSDVQQPVPREDQDLVRGSATSEQTDRGDHGDAKSLQPAEGLGPEEKWT